MEQHNIKLYISRLHLFPILSILGVALAVSCIAAGFYRLGAILAGVDLILTRFALGTLKKSRNNSR